MVDIIIPIYKPVPDTDDCISINRTFEVLGDYDITFVHPENMDLSAYKNWNHALYKGFHDDYFKNIEGYNKLMMSPTFYEAFQKKYILICQTDAFIFKDELAYWCKKNYDYLGAPWLRSREKIPFLKWIWDKIGYTCKTLINYKGNKKWQKDKSLLYNAVGNGGLSLRKREKFIEVLKHLPHVVDLYLKPENKSTFYAEDVFFSIEPLRNRMSFSKPHYQEACLFAIENKQEKALGFNPQKLPFGCHRWNKEKDFWRTIFKDFEYHI